MGVFRITVYNVQSVGVEWSSESTSFPRASCAQLAVFSIYHEASINEIRKGITKTRENEETQQKLVAMIILIFGPLNTATSIGDETLHPYEGF